MPWPQLPELPTGKDILIGIGGAFLVLLVIGILGTCYENSSKGKERAIKEKQRQIEQMEKDLERLKKPQ